jgi:hypothetical protein
MLAHSNREIITIISLGSFPHTLHQIRSTRSSRTTYCPRHSVTLPEEIFETIKRLVTTFCGKVEKNAATFLKTYDLIIYAYIYVKQASHFCKNMHTERASMNVKQYHQHRIIKSLHIFIFRSTIMFF